MKEVILVISFLLDGIFSNFLPVNGIFAPLFTLVSLIVVYPYFDGDKRNYYKYSFVLGLIYDLIYTDTMVYYAFLFLFMAFIIIKLTIILNDNYINIVIITIISIIIFRSITYILMVITGNVSFNYHIWFNSIYSSILANVIYAVILLSIANFINRKIKFKKSHNLRW